MSALIRSGLLLLLLSTIISVDPARAGSSNAPPAKPKVTRQIAALPPPNALPQSVAKEGERQNAPIDLDLPAAVNAAQAQGTGQRSIEFGDEVHIVPDKGAVFEPLFKEIQSPNQASDTQNRGGFTDRHEFGIQLVSRF